MSSHATARKDARKHESIKNRNSGSDKPVEGIKRFDEVRLSGFIPRFYDALACPEEWSALLGEMSTAVGAEGAVIINHAARQQCYPSSERMRALVSSYTRENWASRNPWPQRIVNRGLVNSVATEWNLFSPEELERLPIYNELGLKNGLSSSLTVVLSHDDDMITLSFVRTPCQGPFSESELESFETILPALHQFGKFAIRLGAARDAGTGDLLDQMSDGAILVDSSGRVLHINSAAKHYLNDAIGIDSGHVFALNADAAEQLRDRLAHTLHTVNSFDPKDVNVTTSGPILLPRLSGRPILGEVVPLQRAMGDIFRKASSIITITDPDKRVSVDEDACRHLFGLSPAEARLARALSLGEDIVGFAKTSGLAVDTVRKRAKILLAKTGTRRQAELAALLGRLRRDVVIQGKMAN